MEAVNESEAFSLPHMSEGSDYLYNNLYERLAREESVLLSELDFNAFELDDVDFMQDLYSDILEQNETKAYSIAHSLRGLPPAVVATAFV
jgi:hypothetical protein